MGRVAPPARAATSATARFVTGQPVAVGVIRQMIFCRHLMAPLMSMPVGLGRPLMRPIKVCFIVSNHAYIRERVTHVKSTGKRAKDRVDNRSKNASKKRNTVECTLNCGNRGVQGGADGVLNGGDQVCQVGGPEVSIGKVSGQLGQCRHSVGSFGKDVLDGLDQEKFWPWEQSLFHTRMFRVGTSLATATKSPMMWTKSPRAPVD